MKAHLTKRVLCMMLAVAMVLSLAAPAAAVGHSHGLSFTRSNAASSLEALGQTAATEAAEPEHEDQDIVRVSIVLDDASTLHSGFASLDVAENAEAMAYRAELQARQDDLTDMIERATGKELDVVWNLTLAANLISANVLFGDIAAIEAVPGVKQVILENVYEPAVVADSVKEEADPNMISSTLMTGTVSVWESGYTGAGSRVAVIDTGIDTDHQSFSAKGLEYSLALNAEAEGKTIDEYYAELDLLDEEEIASKLELLNVPGLRADRLYYSTKIPFGYNYIDRNYKVTHDYDEQGEHGSHVEGIAAANSYIPQRDGSFAEALELTNVKGQAPDAQILSMKVFGANGGAYDSDYMAAIEDAIILGADSVNLSLGSGSAGFSFNPTYAELLDSLQSTDTVVTISSGNSYAWDYDAEHDLYVEDIRFATNGSPGSYSNSLGVASVESTFFNEDGSYTAPEFYEMSDFSSWGIPESLELKPEITAPGGNIYSVNGAVAGGKSYESMSGTSMAAPQMAGIAAVMAEYIRENNLVEKTGLTVRQLSQSLLMSTAEALMEESSEYWYSVLKQGAGMARPDLATTSPTYILMGENATAYAADGKVKAELGDDPDKDGIYSFSFSIHNFSDADAAYRLSTELFTQYTNGTYLYGDTDPLSAEVVYTVDGAAYTPVATAVECDLNGDLVTDAADAAIILDYAAGNASEIDPIADLDASGTVDAYDAHMILAGLETGEFTVSAGGSVDVTVTAKLTDEQKAALNEDYPNGAYIEGFVFAAGEITHSIPVLGFYGNWSDPGMFGESYTDILYGADYEPYFGTDETNNLVVGRNGALSLQIGNPYGVEDAYPAGKAAVRSDDILDSYRLAQLRNAGAMMLTILDENGNEYYNSGVSNLKHGAYYYVNGSEWRNTTSDYLLGFTPDSIGLTEGDRFTVTVAAIPEYYALGQVLNADDVHAILDSGVLGKGAALSTELVVDDTAPELVSIARDIETDEIIVTIRDNQYPAALRIVDAKGTVHATQLLETEGQPGSLQQVALNLDGVAAGDPCYISIGDYAANESVYEAHLGLEEPGEGGGTGGTPVGKLEGNMYGFSAHTGSGWVQLDLANGKYDVRAKANVMVEAAEYVDGYLFLVASDGKAYVAPHTNPTALVELADLSAYGVEDMTFNYVDSQMYVLGANNTVYTMNLGDASLTEAFTISVVNTKNAACTTLQGLAADEEGNFYVACDGGAGYEFAAQIFKFTPDMIVDGAVTDLNPMGSGYVGGYTDYGQTLAWDYENDQLYYYSWGRYDIDTFGTVNTSGYSLGGVRGVTAVPKLGLTSIYFPGRTAGVIEFADEAESFTVSTTSLKMLEGSSTTIATAITPWTLADQSLTWVSSDETVVTVNDGTLTAVGQGEATITVTTNAAPHFTAEIAVSVSGIPEVDLYALLQDVDGNPLWVTFNSAEPEAWVAVADNQGTESYGAVNLNDVIYVHDGSMLSAMNPDTFEKEAVTGIGSDYAWPDAAATPFGRIVAPCFAGSGVAVIDPEGDELFDFDLSAALGADLLVTMAYAFEENGVHTLYSVADSGNVYEISLTVTEEGYDLTAEKLCSSPVELPEANEVGGDSTAASIYDAASGTLVIASYISGGSTGYVYALEPNGGASLTLGSIGDAVWPFYSLYTYTAPAELTLRCRTSELSMYKGDEARISASVSPISFTGGVTYTSADESVVVVDANGLVTAVAPGDTTITVASVDTAADGNVLTKVIPVHVEDTIDIDLTINAKLDFDELGSKWVTIDTADVKNPAILGDDHAYLNSAAVHDGVIYANDGKYYIDWNYWAVVSNLYIIEPAYDYDITPGGLIGAENMPTDMSTMPAMTITGTDAEGNEISAVAGDMPIYMDISEQLIMWDVAASEDIAEISGWNLSGEFDGTPGALAYLGFTTQTDDDGVEHDAWSYAVLTNTGALYTINIIAYMEDGAVDYSAYIDQLGNVGLSFDYPEPMHMIYVNDGTYTGLLLGYTDSVAELYYVDLSGDAITSGKIGSIPGTNTFGGMYFPEELAVEAPAAVANRGELLELNAKVGPDRSYTVPSKLTNDRLTFVDGSLAAVTAEAKAEDGENTVRLNLTETVNTVSGVVTVTYDPAVLTYTGSASRLLTAEKVTEGTITLAYANGTEIAAGKLLASLTFTADADYVSTDITVETIQRSAEGTLTGETDSVSITMEPNGHNYTETARVEPTCTESGSVTYTCANCGETYTEVLEPLGHSYEAVVTEPTCTEGGYTTYTCICGDSYIADETPALGHSFGEWIVTTEPGCTEPGVETRTCACGETETRAVEALGHDYEAVVTEPTCTERGYTTYTCACGDSFVGNWVEAKGHSYDSVVTAPTCTEMGFTTHTCTVCAHSYTDSYVNPTGHSYGEWVTVTEPTHDEPGLRERVCSGCGEKQSEAILPLGHAFTQTVVEPTCVTAGYTVNTCDCGLEYITDVTQPTGHSYEAVVTAPTCTEGGYTTYTCSVCGHSYLGDLTPAHCAASAFADVEIPSWYHEAVDFVVDAGLMQGVSETAFNPTGTLNRAQIVTILYRLAGSPAVESGSVFTDVPADSFYADAVAWANANGITSGVSADKFDPNGSVTREQMVTFLYRYVKTTDADVTVTGDLSAFEDAASVSTWAVDAFVWAVEKGVVTGMTETTLVPAATTNRAQAAAVLMRLCNLDA